MGYINVNIDPNDVQNHEIWNVMIFIMNGNLNPEIRDYAAVLMKSYNTASGIRVRGELRSFIADNY